MTEPRANSERLRRHDALGWGALALFALLGLGLEVLHGLRLSVYLDASHGTRRLLWTLAHAHGMLLGLVNLAFAATLRAQPEWKEGPARLASKSLVVATVFMPAGFFLGGAWLMGDDPNPLVLGSAIGGVAFVVSTWLTWRQVRR